MIEVPYKPAKYNEDSFNCPFCGTYARQSWFDVRADKSYRNTTHLKRCECFHCDAISYWNHNTESMVEPLQVTATPAHKDMPELIALEFDEARRVYNQSPRAAAALLRLAVQKLLPEIGATKDNINQAIAELVNNGTLDIEVQQALDYCRVVGNNAVHPGEINLNDTPEMAETLFLMINFIIDQTISKKKRIAEAFQGLPEGARAAIARRDGANSED